MWQAQEPSLLLAALTLVLDLVLVLRALAKEALHPAKWDAILHQGAAPQWRGGRSAQVRGSEVSSV